MSKLVMYFCGLVVCTWLFGFDFEAYHHRNALKHTSNKPTFSNNSSKSKPSHSFLFPLSKKSLKDVISDYGDPRGGGKRRHQGIDIPAKKGTAVLAVADGRISKVTNKGNGGKQVWLKAGEKEFFYAHLDSWNVQQGEIVKRGQKIGTVGNTGNASKTMPHLHFGVYVGRGKTVNPETLFD